MKTLHDLIEMEIEDSRLKRRMYNQISVWVSEVLVEVQNITDCDTEKLLHLYTKIIG